MYAKCVKNPSLFIFIFIFILHAWQNKGKFLLINVQVLMFDDVRSYYPYFFFLFISHIICMSFHFEITERWRWWWWWRRWWWPFKINGKANVWKLIPASTKGNVNKIETDRIEALWIDKRCICSMQKELSLISCLNIVVVRSVLHWFHRLHHFAIRHRDRHRQIHTNTLWIVYNVGN